MTNNFASNGRLSTPETSKAPFLIRYAVSLGQPENIGEGSRRIRVGTTRATHVFQETTDDE